MHTLRVTAIASATVLLLTMGVRDAGATTILITATAADRGIDVFPWDGIDASVFNASVIAIGTPPINTPQASEERSAVEFPLLGIPFGSIIDAVSVRIDPQGVSTNIGLGAGEASDIHGYAGDGAIQVADLNDSLFLTSIAGPVPNGPLTIPLTTIWLQGLVDSSDPFAGLMFKGVPGPIVVVYSFDSAFSGVPVAERPTLIVDYHQETAPVIPEPSTMILFGTGAALAAFRRRTRARRA